MIKRVVGIHYSPAGGTAKMTRLLAREIARRIKENSNCDISLESCELRTGHELPVIDNETVVVLGMPVYVGKIPLPAIKALKEISGSGAMTLALVSYSGRDFGNALYELRYFAAERGFELIGAGAIAINYRRAIAASKRGAYAMDMEALRRYGKAAADKIMRLGGCDIEGLKVKPAPLEVEGRMPVHRISRLSPRAAAIAQYLMDGLPLGRKESEWHL